jgi:fructose-bisphosphate aldolase class II
VPLASVKGILTEARRRRYGVLSLLGGNLDMVIGQVAAAEKLRAPLILAFNQEVTPKVPLELAMPMLVNVAQRATVPVATTLDHGDSLESVLKAIHLGTSSVMFDGSTLPYEENVARTREVVRVAHALGVSVEAELGSIGGSAAETGSAAAPEPAPGGPESAFTDPDLAVEFVQRTGVDALAISFGNAHGTYQGEPALNLNLVHKIHALVEVPLVMHGASGLADGEYRKIVESGISKVCYYTAMGKQVSDEIARKLAAPGRDGAVYHEIIAWAIDAFQQDAERVMSLVGCVGVA